MGKFGFIGPSYTAGSNVIADEECINFYPETIETPGAQAQRSYFGTPGLKVFSAFTEGPVRGQCWTGDRLFVVSNDTLYEVASDGTQTVRMDGILDTFGGPVSIAFSSIELLIVAGGRAYCYELADNTFIDVTAQLAGGPVKVKYSDGYFIVIFANSNKFQISGILDGTTWPGIQVNAVSVFPENIVSIEVSHRELWVFGQQHAQPYQNTGTDEIFDVIPGALIETGGAATFGVDLVDNTVFWISQDIRGARQAWRANGYTPSRISTHAVEAALSSYSADQVSNLVSYSYQDGGHLFWVLYIPGTDCTWVYDVAESLWHKRAEWDQGSSTPDRTIFTNANGQLWMLWSRPLENGHHEITWSDFEIPTGATLPDDAAIQGIFASIIANASQPPAAQHAAQSLLTPSGWFTSPRNTGPGLAAPNDFPDTQFYDGHNYGTSLSVLPSLTVVAGLDASTFFDNMQDTMQVKAVGYAIYYTSATPQIDTRMPAPFAVPPGQGLMWAMPSTQANNQNPTGGLVKITSSQVILFPGGGSAVLLGYDPTTPEKGPLFGPDPLTIDFLGPSGITALGGSLNVRYHAADGFGPATFINTTGATPGPPIYSGGPNQPPFTFYVTTEGATSSPLQPEDALAVTALSLDRFDTGAVQGFPATSTFIPGTVHVATSTYGPHPSWNHTYAFGKHLVGDWNSGNLNEMKLPVDNHDGTYDFVTDNGNLIVRKRRAPTLNDEMEFVYYTQLVVDFATGLGPQPALTDGDGNPRPPQAMLRWSNNGGSTWSNQHIANCGFAGEYDTRVIWRRLGRGRKRVFELTVSDPIPWAICDAYLRTS